MDGMNVDFGSLIEQGAATGASSAISSSGALKSITGAMATGAAVGAALGTVFPGLGNIVGGVVGTVAGAVAGVVPLFEHAFHGQCTLTIDGLDSDCRDYAAHVATAAKWLHEHLEAALHLTPEAFSRQAHILEQDFGEWFVGRNADYRERIRDSGAWEQLQKLPGSRTLLRLVQVPSAAALAGAAPTQALQLRAAMPRTFPALLPRDLDAIAAKGADLHQKQVAAAATWAQSQPGPPSVDEIRAHFRALSPADLQAVARSASSKPAQTPAPARPPPAQPSIPIPSAPQRAVDLLSPPLAAPAASATGETASPSRRAEGGHGVAVLFAGLGVVALAGIALAATRSVKDNKAETRENVSRRVVLRFGGR